MGRRKLAETTNQQASTDAVDENKKRVTFSRDLTCALTREEVEERAQEAASLIERRDQKEADFKEQAKRWKNEIRQLDVEHRLVSSEVRSRTTVRNVECERVFDYAAGLVIETRSDTGEVINSRKMADAERQKDLGLGDDFE